MANVPIRPNARWEPGGVIPLEGAPATASAYTTYTFPSSGTVTTTGNQQMFYYGPVSESPQSSQQLYPYGDQDALKRQDVQRTIELLAAHAAQQRQWQEYMMQQYLQYIGWQQASPFSPAAEEKPLETKELSALDRLKLQEELPW